MDDHYASERKRADPLGWPFGSLPVEVIERELRKRDLAGGLWDVAEPQPEKEGARPPGTPPA